MNKIYKINLIVILYEKCSSYHFKSFTDSKRVLGNNRNQQLRVIAKRRRANSKRSPQKKELRVVTRNPFCANLETVTVLNVYDFFLRVGIYLIQHQAVIGDFNGILSHYMRFCVTLNNFTEYLSVDFSKLSFF